MLPVNAVGERLEGKPHEPFDGGRKETSAINQNLKLGFRPARLSTMARAGGLAMSSSRLSPTLHRKHGLKGESGNGSAMPTPRH